MHLYDQIFNNNFLSRGSDFSASKSSAPTNQTFSEQRQNFSGGIFLSPQEKSNKRYENFRNTLQNPLISSPGSKGVGYDSINDPARSGAFEAHTARLESKGHRNLIDARPKKHYGLGGELISAI
jgi:hypothetical protein